MNDPTLDLPFDQYQRYRLVADILDEVRREGETLTVLDVGGRTELLRLFLPEDVVHLVDVEASEARELVLGDGSRLPFATNSVDAVVNFDTLEHVPPPFREAFLSECRRVARSWVVVAGPFDTEGVEEAETLLETFIHEKLREEHRYLAEHKQYGLPHLDETEAALGGEGAATLSIGHANLERWVPLMCLELYLDRDRPCEGSPSRSSASTTRRSTSPTTARRSTATPSWPPTTARRCPMPSASCNHPSRRQVAWTSR